VSSLKIDEIDKSISLIQAYKSPKRDFRDFSGAKVYYSNRNVKFHAHGMERGEVLKRCCVSQSEATLLKQTPKDRTCIHAAGALQLNAWKSIEVSKNNTRKIGY